MSRSEQSLHEGKRFPVVGPGGRIELLTPKEYMARKSRLRLADRYEEQASPDAGSRRVRNMGGIVLSRKELPEPDAD